MNGFLMALLKMSLTASYVALVVMAVRAVLRTFRVPAIFSYALWFVVLFRLLIPVSFESPVSLLPREPYAIAHEMVSLERLAGSAERAVQEQSVTPTLQQQGAYHEAQASGDHTVQMIMKAGLGIWLLGVAAFAMYSVVTSIRLKNRLAFATKRAGHIYETDRVHTPFVLGFLKPRIYLPAGLGEQDAELIVKHEQVHIRRGDHLIKPLAFIALALHWFNPLVWLSYALMMKDMEMSCDEKVMKEAGGDLRKNYARTLLVLASKQSGLLAPPSFSESHVKSRVRNILHYRRPKVGAGGVTLLLVSAIAFTLLVNPALEKETTMLAGYIVVDGDILHVDEVEVLTTEETARLLKLPLYDPERLEELGIGEANMPNGYYLHDPGSDTMSLELAEDTVYTFTDVHLLFVEEADGDRLYTTTDKEHFLLHLHTAYSGMPAVPFFLEVQEGRVVRITEKFLFTQ